MSKQDILNAQEYLTVEGDEGERRIVDILHLLQNHSVGEVVLFLKEYLKEKENTLKNLILISKRQRRIEKCVGAMFRLTMAIKTLEESEVINIEISQHGSDQSRRVRARHRRGSNRTRCRQNRSDDAADRSSRHQTQRAA